MKPIPVLAATTSFAVALTLLSQVSVAAGASPVALNVSEIDQLHTALASTVEQRIQLSLDPSLRTAGSLKTDVVTPRYLDILKSEDALLEEQRRLYAEFGEAFVSFEVAVTIDAATITHGVADVAFVEDAMLQRTPDSTGLPRPDYGYRYHQSARLLLIDGQWRVDDVRSEEAPPATALPDKSALEARSNGTFRTLLADALLLAEERKVSAEDLALMGSGVTNSMVQSYALTYWNFYNPAYRTQTGNDCTNFVSQALYYAGANQVTGWYTAWNAWWYNSSNQSHTWINAQKLADFGVYYDARFTAAGSGWVVGDIAFWIWESSVDYLYDHASVVTAVDGLGRPYFTQHTADRYNESLVAYYGREPDLYVADLHNT